MQDLQVCKSCRSRQELSHEYLRFTSIHLQILVSIQPRTTLSKFGGAVIHLFIRLRSRGSTRRFVHADKSTRAAPVLATNAAKFWQDLNKFGHLPKDLLENIVKCVSRVLRLEW